MGRLNRTGSNIEARRWTLIASALELDEKPLMHTPWAASPDATPRNNAYGLLYVTDRQIIVANTLDKKLKRLTGWITVDYEDVGGVTFRPDTMMLRLTARAYYSTWTGDWVTESHLQGAPVYEETMYLFPSQISGAIAQHISEAAR